MMIKEIPIQVKGSMQDARMHVYLWEESPELAAVERPLILICPGGGYVMTSDREADPLASQFWAMGYHVAILRYSVEPAEYPVALLELATAMKTLHENKEDWRIDTDKIFVMGASAGGHLAASLGVFWKKEWIAKELQCNSLQLKPAGMILCYPVITSGEFAHRGSFEALLKNQYTEEMLELTSLEKQVNSDTPPAFIWHTYTDDCVPVENSLFLIQAMKKYEIPVEFHMYPVGGHGLSTCNELAADRGGYGVQKQCSSWLPLVKNWLAYYTSQER